jgi:hypothetical protein
MPVMPPKYVSPAELAATLDGAWLLAEATERKTRANDYFSSGLFDAALHSYLTAIWFLKIVRPIYPEVLSGQLPPSDDEAVKLLGHGAAIASVSKKDAAAAEAAAAAAAASVKKARQTQCINYGITALAGAWMAALMAALIGASMVLSARVMGVMILTAALPCVGMYALWRSGTAALSPDEADDAAAAAAAAAIAAAENDDEATSSSAANASILRGSEAKALRVALHLNVAACALKRTDWYLAREAAKVVLADEPGHPKALYRLAQAWDGAGDSSEAMRTLQRLLKLEGQHQNLEARRLLADVKQRRERERTMFAGVCNKSGFCQSEAEAAAAHARDAAAKRLMPKSPLDQRFDAYAEYEKRRAVGFKWECVPARPVGGPGKELSNEGLAAELTSRSLGKPDEFTWVELDQLNVPNDLSADDYIMVGGECFQPRPRGWSADEPVQARSPARAASMGEAEEAASL